MTTATTGQGQAVSLQGITRRFGIVLAVDDVHLEVAGGDFLAILGPSGCGKSTLLRMVAGLDHPDQGRVVIGGRDLTNVPPERRPTNLVFQRGAVFPHLSVFENIAYPLRLRRRPRSDVEARVAALLSLTRMEGMGTRRPSELSGGQLQRVALARALAAEPGVLLLDEPLSALDLKLRKELQLELRRIHQEIGTTFVYVTHDQEEALALSDYIALMDGGRIVQVGTPVDVYHHPSTRFASAFIGESNHISGVLELVDDGTAIVRSEGGGAIRATALAGTPPLGSSVLVAVRPEQIALLPETDQRESPLENSIGGSVEEVVFTGSTFRVRCRTDLGVELWAEVRASRTGGPVVGDSVRLNWPVADCQVLS